MCKLSLVYDICPDFYTGHNPDETKLSLLWRRFPPLKRAAMKNTCCWLVWTGNILGLGVFFDKCSFFKTGKSSPFLHKKKIVGTESNSVAEVKTLMADLVLVPGFPKPKSRAFSVNSTNMQGSFWVWGTIRCWGHTISRYRTVSEFRNFGNSQVPWQRDTCL